MKNALKSASAGFAHLLGRDTAPPAPDATNDKKRDDETEEEFETRRDRDSAAGEDLVQRDDESDEDFEKRKKEATAKAADTDGDDKTDKDDAKDKAVGPARERMRARCRAIFADPAAGRNPPLAATLAFDTDLPRSEAIAVLRAGGVAVTAARNTLDTRMAAIKIPPIAAGDGKPPQAEDPRGGKTAAQQGATAVIVGGMRRRGEKPEAIQAFIDSQTAA